VSRNVIFLEGDPHINCQTDEGSVEVPSDLRIPASTEAEVELPDHDDNASSCDPQPIQQENHTVQPQAEVRISSRSNKGKPPERLIETVNKAAHEATEPKSFTDALASTDSKKWIEAMNAEMESLQSNETWNLTTLPEGKTAIGCKWVYKTKTDELGNVVRYKARLVAQGFTQKYGDDYDEVFAPVARSATLRTMLAIAGSQKMIVKHYDIQAAYLNGDLSHEVYMRQPKGYHQGDDSLVCKLKKSLYGLKQGANEWNKRLNNIFTSNMKFSRSKNDPCLYSKEQDGHWLYVSVHVDYLVMATTSESMMVSFEGQMNEFVVMKDLGNLHHYLGIQIARDDDGIFVLHQKQYIEKKLREFRLTECRPSNIPVDPGYLRRQEVHECMPDRDVYRKAIGSLQYLATNSRPDIAVGTSILARHVSCPTVADWTEVKRIFRYISHTKDMKLKLGDASLITQRDSQLIGYADADWGGDAEDRKSNTGYVFKYLGAPLTWSSKKHSGDIVVYRG